jgi:hypothetical protein
MSRNQANCAFRPPSNPCRGVPAHDGRVRSRTATRGATGSAKSPVRREPEAFTHPTRSRDRDGAEVRGTRRGCLSSAASPRGSFSASACTRRRPLLLPTRRSTDSSHSAAKRESSRRTARPRGPFQNPRATDERVGPWIDIGRFEWMRTHNLPEPGDSWSARGFSALSPRELDALDSMQSDPIEARTDRLNAAARLPAWRLSSTRGRRNHRRAVEEGRGHVPSLHDRSP